MAPVRSAASIQATLTGPSHGAPRAPPAGPGAAATAAAAIPGPGAAPHPAPPPAGRPEMASRAPRPRRGEMTSGPLVGERRPGVPRRGGGWLPACHSQRPLWWENELLSLGPGHVNRTGPGLHTLTPQGPNNRLLQSILGVPTEAWPSVTRVSWISGTDFVKLSLGNLGEH